MDNSFICINSALGFEQINVSGKVKQNFNLLFRNITRDWTPESTLIALLGLANSWLLYAAFFFIRCGFDFTKKTGLNQRN